MNMVLSIISNFGSGIMKICNQLGDFALFLIRAIKTMFSSRLKFRQLFAQMEQVGVGSFSIVFLTGLSTGLALALQSYVGFRRVGAEEFIGLIVTLGMARELGPVLTSLMVTGRSGSSMAAEIGTMRITEQIDALKTLCIDPFQYLIVPRILASTIIMPFLTIFSVICGTIGGFIFCVYVLGFNPETYVKFIESGVQMSDIIGGLIKSAFFGLIFSWVGTYKGYRTSGGARGVGQSTTQAVVVGCIMILIANYLLSSILFQTGI